MASNVELAIVIGAKDTASKVIGDVGDKLGGLGKAAGLAAAAAGTAALGFAALAVKAASDAQLISTQTDAVLKSTGGVAGMTTKSVEDLATALSQVTPFEDDLIQKTQNMLLTFTSISKDIFPEVTETALNMATALGGDSVSSAVMLGKALNDPISGLTALRKVGVQFTDAQEIAIKKMVESGDVMGAQKLILAELAVEFGGSARAAGTTFAGQLAIAKNTAGNLMETIGKSLLPVLTDLLRGIGPILAAFGEKLPAMIGTASDAVGRAVSVFRDLFGIISGSAPSAGGALVAVFGQGPAEMIAGFAAVVRTSGGLIGEALRGNRAEADGLAEVIKQRFGVDMPQPIYAFVNLAQNTLAGFATAIRLIFEGDIGGALTQFATTWQTWTRGIWTIVVDAIPGITAAFMGWAKAAVDWITVTAIPKLREELPGFLNAMLSFVTGNIDKVVDAMLAVGREFFAWVPKAIPPLLTALLGLLTDVLSWLSEHAEEIGAKLAEWGMKFGEFIVTVAIPAILEALPGIIVTIAGWVVGTAIPAIVGIFFKLGRGILTGILDGIERLTEEIGSSINAKLNEIWEDALVRVRAWRDIGDAIVNGIRDGISRMWGGLMANVRGLIDQIPQAVRSLLGIGSPSRVFAEIGETIPQGLAVGITKGTPEVLAAMNAQIAALDAMQTGFLDRAGKRHATLKSLWGSDKDYSAGGGGAGAASQRWLDDQKTQIWAQRKEVMDPQYYADMFAAWSASAGMNLTSMDAMYAKAASDALMGSVSPLSNAPLPSVANTWGLNYTDATGALVGPITQSGTAQPLATPWYTPTTAAVPIIINLDGEKIADVVATYYTEGARLAGGTL